jgi:hypothetical protein
MFSTTTTNNDLIIQPIDNIIFNIINSTSSSSSSESEPTSNTTAKPNETRNSTFITTVAQRSSFYSKAEVTKAKEATDLFENMVISYTRKSKEIYQLRCCCSSQSYSCCRSMYWSQNTTY